MRRSALQCFVVITTAACALTGRAQMPRPWTEYRSILWMGEQAGKSLTNPRLPERLRELGITTGMTGPGGDTTFYQRNGFGYYVENIVNEGLCLKFRSKVTDWNKFVS